MRVLEMLQPKRFRAKLQEPPVAGDPTSGQTAEQLPTYNAYSADGDVTAPLIYVNYGNRDDYEELDRLGISVKGAIVIARYGEGWRGVKPKVAAEHGAIGCIIYSDPRGDGYFKGEEYPGWRMAVRERRATRQRHGYGLPRRSLDPGRRRNRKCQAAGAQGREDHHRHSGTADFIRRCSAASLGAQGPGGAGEMAGRAADDLSRRVQDLRWCISR